MAGESLQEQLIKAGLATANQAKKVERQKKVEARARKSTGDAPANATSTKVAKAKKLQAEKAKTSRAQAGKHNQVASEKAIRAQIRQIIAQHDQRDLKAADADVPYNFLHGKKIKRIYVTATHKTDLVAGRLAIINCDGRYHLVGPEAAEKIRSRDPKWVVAQHNPDEKAPAPDPDDPYAEYQVPDDLDW